MSNYNYHFAKSAKAILLRVAEEFGLQSPEVDTLRETSFRKGDRDVHFVIFFALAKVLKGIHESGCPPSQKKGAVKQLLRITTSYKRRQIPRI